VVEGAVEDEGGVEVLVVGGVAEGLAAAPAVPRHRQLAVARRQLQRVGGDGVEVGGDLLGFERVDRLGCGVAGREVDRAAALEPLAGEQVGGERDVAGLGELVGDAAHPVGEAAVLVDDDHRRRLGLALGVDDEGVDGALAVLHRHPLVVARRLLQPRQGPVLGEHGGGEQAGDGDNGNDGCLAVHGEIVAEW